MSLMSLAHAVERIRQAREGQEIAVFQAPPGRAGLNCVFARTVETYRRLQAGDPMLIGVFDGSMAPDEVTQALRPYAKADDDQARG